MVSKSGAVWAIDIGNNALKALHLSEAGGSVEVIGFDNIQHGKILTGSGVKAAERDELIALSLRRLVTQNDLGKDDIIVSVPSQNSFARFVNLPPVDAKRIPEIVKFEAAQQIPFDINDVQWDWQLMTKNSGENRVGIFAVKNEVVTSSLDHLGRENIQVGYVQMAPMALYNYLLYDRPDLCRSDSQAAVVLNVGAETTDLVVCTRSTVWHRSIPMGGNAFTRAIAEAFKLDFTRAEKLKRTAPMSKYARQIFQAMRPVFTDLATEVQRSLGFYRSSNPNTKLSKIIAMGGVTKMRGLLKYLQQTLQIPVERPDSFKRLTINSSVSVAKFHESVCDFGVVYGLALQVLGLARIESNLLPRSIARSMVWVGKAKYFTAAACLLFLVSILSFARTFFDRVSYNSDGNKKFRREVKNVIAAENRAIERLEKQKRKEPISEAKIQKAFDLFKYRDVIPLLHQTIISTLPNEKNNPEQRELYRAFDRGDAKAVREIPRKQRKQIFVTGMSINFVGDVTRAIFGRTSFMMGRSGGLKGMPMGYSEMDDFEMLMDREMIGELGGKMPPRYQPKKYTKPGKNGETTEGGAGFVVTIVGYSPYENIRELMDPAGVEDDQTKWGVVARLLHLDDVVDGNSPFKLYGRTEIRHFKLETGEVDLDSKTPVGIGLIEDVELKESESYKRRAGSRQVLIDPLTKEVISKVAELDDRGREKFEKGQVVYKVNDHWFVLSVKLVWADAPKETEKSGG